MSESIFLDESVDFYPPNPLTLSYKTLFNKFLGWNRSLVKDTF